METTEYKSSLSKTIKSLLVKQGRSKKWLAEMLGISRPTLYSKFNENRFTQDDLTIMADLGMFGMAKK